MPITARARPRVLLLVVPLYVGVMTTGGDGEPGQIFDDYLEDVVSVSVAVVVEVRLDQRPRIRTESVEDSHDTQLLRQGGSSPRQEGEIDLVQKDFDLFLRSEASEPAARLFRQGESLTLQGARMYFSISQKMSQHTSKTLSTELAPFRDMLMHRGYLIAWRKLVGSLVLVFVMVHRGEVKTAMLLLSRVWMRCNAMSFDRMGWPRRSYSWSGGTAFSEILQKDRKTR